MDTSLSVQKSVDYSHAKSRSIDNTFDKKTAGSVNSLNSLTSLNTSASSLQPIKNEQDTKPNYSTTANINASINSGQYIKQNTLVKNEPPSIPSLDKWIRKDGPLRLQEALNNLKLDLKSVNKVNLSSLSYDQLCNEKKNVKNELKAYDAQFAVTFKRAPEREEKEPMRPLYIYYKKIKQYMIKNIEKAKANKGASITQSNVTQGGLAGPDKGGRTLKTNKMLANEKENKLIGQSGTFERKLETSFETQLSKDKGFFNIGEDRGDFNERNLRQMGAKGGIQIGGMSQDQIRRQLEEYKAVRVQLRERLHSYQTEFTRNNNRKIKYHRDIAPVENEYKRYKDIKTEINRLESLLNPCA